MSKSDTACLQAVTAVLSEARAAAELVFSIPMTTSPKTGGEPIVIVRSKKVVNSEHSGSLHECHDYNQAARQPKVYRIESSHLRKDPRVLQFGPFPSNDLEERATSDLVDCLVAKRRRHRRHGDVTITRPVPPTASELAERKRIAIEHYERLRAEIVRLDRQVEAAKKV